MKPLQLVLLVCLTLTLFPALLHAQEESGDRAAPLEEFVQRVARLWSTGEVAELVEMIPEGDRFLLDTGDGIETANTRHAAAALRALFSQKETLRASPVRVTVSSAEPVSGFGEISWTYRIRGAPGEELRSVYVGARWEDENWRIAELRIMP
jgi:hypothetical protein